jgi:hypothetical protein
MPKDEESSSSGDSRRNYVLRHPLFHQHVGGCLWTPPVEQLYLRVKRTILLRQSAYIEEVTGQGKTCAAELILRQLPRDFEGLACVSFNARTNRFPFVRAFFKEILFRLDHPMLKGDAWDLRNRVGKKLEDLAVQSLWAMVFLWIDEAQALSLDEFLFLRDVQNDLRKVEADLVVLLTGEAPELSRRLDGVKWSRSESVPDRFAVERLPLNGYDVTALRALLEQIDRAIWPSNSSVTWTQFFFPRAVEAGFRVSSQAEACMDALASAKLLRSDDTCQPRLLRYVLERFFLDNDRHDKSGMIIPVTAWSNAVLDAKHL